MSLFDFFKKKEPVVKVPKGFYVLQVKEIVQLTPESIKLIFAIPESLAAVFQFIPGQYIDIALPIDGKEIRRSYSICSGVGEDLAVGIKKVEGGAFTSYALEKLKVGDAIWLSKPQGNFTWDESAKKIVAFAAGSGITPILSIAKSAQEKGQSMELFYGNRTVESTMFREEIEALKDPVKVVHYLTREKQSNTSEGRLSKAIADGLFENNPALLEADTFYVCGPQDLVEDVKAALIERNIDDSKLYFELFNVKVDPSAVNEPTIEGTATVTTICDQEETTFEMDVNSNVLEEALANDVDAPYSCRGGVCSSCKCKIIEGTAEMRINFTLSDSEIKQGYLLSCQAYPTSEKLVVSYDE